MACEQIPPNPNLVIPELLPLDSLAALYQWYRVNVCESTITEARGNRIRFLPENFIHLIKLTNKYGKEPKNARLALDEIQKGRLTLIPGRFAMQRAKELSWATLIAREPDRICTNWKADGHAGEAYIKNFGSFECPRYRVLICEVHGRVRRPVTIFPRDHISGKELHTQVWP